MTTRYVRPALRDPENPKEGVKPIRDPADGLQLTAEGKSVEWSDFWARRELDGDVTVGEPPAEPRHKPAAAETETPPAETRAPRASTKD